MGLNRTLWSGLAAVWLGAMPAGVLAQSSTEFRVLSDRIERLQRDVDSLQRQPGRSSAAPSSVSSAPSAGGPVPTPFIAQTDARFAELEAQLRELTGRVEELSHNMAQLRSRIDKLVGDVDYRLGALERGGQPPGPGASAERAAPPPPEPPRAAAAPPPPGQQALVAPGQPRLQLVPGGPPGQPAPGAQAAPAALPSGSAEEQYRFAYNQLAQAQREQGDFGRAEQAFRSFLAAHPNHELSGNAQYWLGETYYVRRDYQEAATVFAEGARKYTKGEKAADMWLKLGMSLGQLKRNREACGAFTELDRRFPQAPTSVKQVATRERRRLEC